jgi:YHS domain-containing protein
MVIGYVIYRAYQRFKESLTLQRQPPQSERLQEPDTLMQDPVCGTFIPRKEALKLVKDGKEYFFCSEGCLKRFRRSGGK